MLVSSFYPFAVSETMVTAEKQSQLAPNSTSTIEVVLTPTRSKSEISEIVLSAGEHTFGADQSVNHQLPINGVAALHCMVTVKADQATLQSYDSHTWVNEGPIKNGRLKQGDRLLIGPVEFRVSLRKVTPVITPEIKPESPPIQPAVATTPSILNSAVSQIAEFHPLLQALSLALELGKLPTDAQQLIQQVHRESVGNPNTVAPLPVSEKPVIKEDIVAQLKQSMQESRQQFDHQKREIDQLMDTGSSRLDPVPHTTPVALPTNHLIPVVEIPGLDAIITEQSGISLTSDSVTAQLAERDELLKQLQASQQEIERLKLHSETSKSQWQQQLEQRALAEQKLRADLEQLQQTQSNLVRSHTQHIDQLERNLRTQQHELQKSQAQLSQHELTVAEKAQVIDLLLQQHQQQILALQTSEQNQVAKYEQQLREAQLAHIQIASEKDSVLLERTTELDQRHSQLAQREQGLAEREQELLTLREDQIAYHRELDAKHLAAVEKNEALQREYQANLDRLTTQEANLQAAQEKLNQEQAQLAADAAALQMETDDLKLVRQDLDRRTQTIAAREFEHESLVKQLADQQASFVASQTQHSNNMEEIIKLRAELQMEQDDLKLVRQDLDQRTQNVAAREFELATQSKHIADQLASLTENQAKHAQDTAELNQLRDELQMEQDDLKLVRQDLDLRTQTVAAREFDLATREKNIQDSQVEFMAEKSQYESDCEAITKLRAELQLEQDDLKLVRSDLDQRTQNVTAREFELAAEAKQLVDLRSELELSEQLFNERQNSAQSTPLTLVTEESLPQDHDVAEKLAELELREAELKSQQTELESRQQEVDDRSRVLEIEAELLQEKETRVVKLEQSLTQQMSDLQTERDALGIQEAALNAARDQLNIERENLEHKITNQHQALEDALARASSRIDDLVTHEFADDITLPEHFESVTSHAVVNDTEQSNELNLEVAPHAVNDESVIHELFEDQLATLDLTSIDAPLKYESVSSQTVTESSIQEPSVSDELNLDLSSEDKVQDEPAPVEFISDKKVSIFGTLFDDETNENDHVSPENSSDDITAHEDNSAQEDIVNAADVTPESIEETPATLVTESQAADEVEAVEPASYQPVSMADLDDMPDDDAYVSEDESAVEVTTATAKPAAFDSPLFAKPKADDKDKKAKDFRAELSQLFGFNLDQNEAPEETDNTDTVEIETEAETSSLESPEEEKPSPYEMPTWASKFNYSNAVESDAALQAEVPETAAVAPQPRKHGLVVEEEGKAEQECEDSVAKYMEKLLARSRGWQSAQPEETQPVKVEKQRPVETPAVMKVARTFIESEDEDDASLKESEIQSPATPRAPVDKDSVRKNMTDFRNVANKSAKVAINKHSIKKLKTKIMVDYILIAFSFIVSLGLTYSNLWTTDNYIAYATISGIIGICAMLELLRSKYMMRNLDDKMSPQ